MQRKPWTGRVWGHFALRSEDKRALRLCASNDEQPDGVDRSDRRPSSSQKTLQGESDHRFQLRGQGHDRVDTGLDEEEVDEFAEKACSEQRSLGNAS